MSQIATFVINMRKDTQKRALIEQQLAEHPELSYQICEAIEGRKLSEKEQQTFFSPDFFSHYGRNASLPAAGCSASHTLVYRAFLATSETVVLVLEDDALLSKEMCIWPLISLLDVDEPRVVLLTPDFWYRKEQRVRDIKAPYQVYQISSGYMASGYLINRSAAQLLIESNTPVRYLADDWKAFEQLGLKVYGVVPHLISFPDGMGEIGKSIRQAPKSVYARLRAIAVQIYIQFLNSKKYLKGYRHSTKKWK